MHQPVTDRVPRLFPPFLFLLEDLLAGTKNFVQRLLKVCRRAGKVCSDLGNILIVALLDLVLEELLERSFLEALGVLSRIIRHHVRYECASESLCAQSRIASEERVDRPAFTGRR